MLFAIDIGVAQFQIEGKEDQYQILDETISSEQYAVGFFLGNTALRDEVQSTLLEMVEDRHIRRNYPTNISVMMSARSANNSALVLQ